MGLHGACPHMQRSWPLRAVTCSMHFSGAACYCSGMALGCQVQFGSVLCAACMGMQLHGFPPLMRPECMRLHSRSVHVPPAPRRRSTRACVLLAAVCRSGQPQVPRPRWHAIKHSVRPCRALLPCTACTSQWYSYHFARSKLRFVLSALNAAASLWSVGVYVYSTYNHIPTLAKYTYFVCPFTFLAELLANTLAARCARGGRGA